MIPRACNQSAIVGSTMKQSPTPICEPADLEAHRLVSLKALAKTLETTRTSARRWLQESGIRPVAIGRGRNGAIRYRWDEVRTWLESRQAVS